MTKKYPPFTMNTVILKRIDNVVTPINLRDVWNKWKYDICVDQQVKSAFIGRAHFMQERVDGKFDRDIIIELLVDVARTKDTSELENPRKRLFRPRGRPKEQPRIIQKPVKSILPLTHPFATTPPKPAKPHPDWEETTKTFKELTFGTMEPIPEFVELPKVPIPPKKLKTPLITLYITLDIGKGPLREQIESQVLSHLQHLYRDNRTLIADVYGISVKTLRVKIKEYDLKLEKSIYSS